PQGSRKTKAELFPSKTLIPYKDSVDWDAEFPEAQIAVAALSESIESIFESAARGGAIEISKLKKAVDPMIRSISRNPDGCIWLARLKQEDHYTYQHSLGASIWAVSLGRQLGLPKSDLRSLALGALLLDVGKLQLDKGLLKLERQLTPEEFEVVKGHVELGVEAIKENGILNKDVVDMVASHHERHDGSGYPRGIKGDSIPVFARIAAIVDCYDAITSNRSYARGIPPAQAIKKIYEWRDIDFQAELVEEFIQAIGIYPAGSLVELSSGEIAVVAAEYPTRRLRPRVMVLLDADHKPLENIKMVDLFLVKLTDNGQPLEIVNSLEPNAYGIDMSAIQL
ncbi:MAG: putative nucleotidyltransferase with HDIG domain, partial [Cryomorphaceae bacterium]